MQDADEAEAAAEEKGEEERTATEAAEVAPDGQVQKRKTRLCQLAFVGILSKWDTKV